MRCPWVCADAPTHGYVLFSLREKGGINAAPKRPYPARVLFSLREKGGINPCRAESLRHLVLFLFLLLAIAATSHAQRPLAKWQYDKGATTLELTGVFDPPPPTGYQPVRVQAANGFTEKRSWRLEFSASADWRQRGSARSTFNIDTEPGQSASSVLLVPQANENQNNSYHQLRIIASSAQLPTQNHHDSSNRVQQFPAIAISDALAQKSLTLLGDETQKVITGGGSYGPNIFGSRFRPDQLPEDWLGFSGFDFVMLTTDEWLALAPGARTALLQWVNFGGSLHLYRTTGNTTLDSLGGALSPQMGLGFIELLTWNGDTLDAPVTVARYHRKSENFHSHLSSGYNAPGAWERLRALGEQHFANWQVALFLLVFGVLIGPVNLFVLAPAGKRHKLFYTTPLISLAASTLLIGLIFIQDGTGGQGRRFIAIQIAPEEASAYVTQEQVSRTGVLFRSSFTLPRPGLIHQVPLPESPWVKFTGDYRSQPMEVRLDGANAGGNWFQSRAVQAQFLRTLVPTRGRIELVPNQTPDAPPAIVSSLDLVLEKFMYIDARGGGWKAEAPVRKGQPVTLAKADLAWLKEARGSIDSGSQWLAPRLQSMPSQQPGFVATASAAPGFAIDTLPSIDWKDDKVLVFGAVATPQ